MLVHSRVVIKHKKPITTITTKKEEEEEKQQTRQHNFQGIDLLNHECPSKQITFQAERSTDSI